MNLLQMFPTIFAFIVVTGFSARTLAQDCDLGHSNRVAAVDVKKFDRERALVFMGSSTIDFWTSMPTDFPQFQTVNLGIAGSRYNSLAASAGACAKKYPAKNFVLYSGENDIAWMSSPSLVADNFETAVKGIRKNVRGAKIYVFNLKPSKRLLLQFGRLEAVNNKLEAKVAKLNSQVLVKDITLIDINSAMDGQSGLFSIDGIHMTQKGYRLWTQALMSELIRNGAVPSVLR